MAKNIEIEIKYPLMNPDEVENKLIDAQFLHSSKQHDIYYSPLHRDFVGDIDNVNEWLRVRILDNKTQINYKDWQPHDQKIKTHCIEYETDVQSFEQFQNILNSLDFRELVQVRKHRKSWLYEDAEISLDSVEDLGSFIEIEYKGDLEDINEARSYLTEILKRLGAITGEIDRRGYPYQLLEMKKIT